MTSTSTRSAVLPPQPSPPNANGQYRIGKAFTFEAAHELSNVARTHRCAGQHGHSYTVGLALTADTLVAPGFVTDFGDLEPFKRYLADALDHRNLNEILGDDPTRQAVEAHLAVWLADNLEPDIPGRVEAVRVSDSGSTGHRIGRTITFAASHQLPGLPVGHKCGRRHGHSYAAGLVLASDQVMPAGFVSDCGGMDLFEDYVASTCNTDLNSVLEQPTSERIAAHLATWFLAQVQPRITDTLQSVWVSETPATWASYTLNGAIR